MDPIVAGFFRGGQFELAVLIDELEQFEKMTAEPVQSGLRAAIDLARHRLNEVSQRTRRLSAPAELSKAHHDHASCR